ncbi:MAG: aspartate aminotransferase family protein [Deltaproteobacteria bacterium]|nr:aspartate aminotransferase family protein [Deltaproteobacteria bacterium]
MKLLNYDDCNEMPIETVWEYYRKHINPAQVDLIASFGFGKELVSHSEGPWITTRSGKRILDFTGGIGVLNHGHNHPRILAVRRKYAQEKRMEVHKNFFSPYLAALSHNLAQLFPEDLDFCYFPNSGAEAVEGAIKLAYKYHEGQRKTILYSDISFHGKLLGAASVTGSPELDFKFPQISGCHSFQYDCLESVEELINKTRTAKGSSDVYALILEPMNASSLRECSPEFLRGVRNLCTKENIVLIFDEVYTGWAKTGSLFYFFKAGVIPDIVTMSKSFGGGKASIAGYVTRRPIFLKAYGNLNDATLHSTTYYGFGEEAVSALEAVNIIVEEDYVNKAQHIYDCVHPRLVELQTKYPTLIKEVRGAGALNGILFNDKLPALQAITSILPSKLFRDSRFIQKVVTSAVINHLYNEFGILSFFGSNREIVFIVSPPLVIEERELDYFLTSLDKTLAQGLGKLITGFVKDKFFAKKTQEKKVA